MENLDTEKACFIIAKSRQFSAKEGEVTPDWGSDGPSDQMWVTLQDTPDDPAREELLGAIHSLDEDERIELFALVLIGRGDYDVEQWEEALRESQDNPDNRTPRHLARMPMLGDHIEAGLNMLGFTCG